MENDDDRLSPTPSTITASKERWFKHQDSEGNTYYFCHTKNKSQWTLPQGNNIVIVDYKRRKGSDGNTVSSSATPSESEGNTTPFIGSLNTSPITSLTATPRHSNGNSEDETEVQHQKGNTNQAQISDSNSNIDQVESDTAVKGQKNFSSMMIDRNDHINSDSASEASETSDVWYENVDAIKGVYYFNLAQNISQWEHPGENVTIRKYDAMDFDDCTTEEILEKDETSKIDSNSDDSTERFLATFAKSANKSRQRQRSSGRYFK